MESTFKTIICTFSLMVIPAANGALIEDRGIFESELDSMVIDDYENSGYGFIQKDDVMSAVLGETRYQSTSALDFNLVFDNLGNHLYCVGCNGSFLLDFNSTSVGENNGVYGVGFDYSNASEPAYNAFITYGDNSTENVLLDQIRFPDSGFLGITSENLISSIHFGLAGGMPSSFGDMRIDNLTIGSKSNDSVPGQDPAPIPEPASIALFGIGLVGLGYARRRKDR